MMRGVGCVVTLLALATSAARAAPNQWRAGMLGVPVDEAHPLSSDPLNAGAAADLKAHMAKEPQPQPDARVRDPSPSAGAAVEPKGSNTKSSWWPFR